MTLILYFAILLVSLTRTLIRILSIGFHQLAQKNGYARSLFERLQSLGHSYRLLDVQYRMHPAISAFPNKQFYYRKLKNGDNVLLPDYEKFPYQKDMFGPYAFIDIPDGTEVNAGSSKKNVLEAELVLHLIRRIHDSGNFPPQRVGNGIHISQNSKSVEQFLRRFQYGFLFSITA